MIRTIFSVRVLVKKSKITNSFRRDPLFTEISSIGRLQILILRIVSDLPQLLKLEKIEIAYTEKKN